VGELQLSETAQVSAMMTAEANDTATAVAQVHPTATAQAFANTTATAQAIADQNPYPPFGGVLALSDPLSSNSQGHDWEVYSRPAMNNCQFVGGAYESTVSYVYIVGSNICIAKSTNFTNFAYQVQMTLRNTLTVYAIGQKIATVNHSYNPYGQIGCESTSIGGVLTVAIFRNAKVWVF
jgi:hypothetical protein